MPGASRVSVFASTTARIRKGWRSYRPRHSVVNVVFLWTSARNCCHFATLEGIARKTVTSEANKRIRDRFAAPFSPNFKLMGGV